VKIGRGLDVHRDESRLKQWFWGDYETTTDAAGGFAFDGIELPTGLRLPPYISAIHYAHGASRVHELPTEDATLDLVLLGAGAIDGVVEGTRGEHRFVDVVAVDEPQSARWNTIDNAGAFRFEDVPCGDYVVSLRGHASDVIASASVTVLVNQSTKVTVAVKDER
jgi:hypothetical protein